ncbi:GNAT family N-acetyltransferase [Frigidibacter albus]|uniref:GNAT family N-acetyltransferase n=1 Tax=Frigidibacter albus TaxID=1465486 RepID=A0A6L8VKM5_9RHOB|nr:GNAT family N-acetyltransferase [Frigidibacter albus]MZQ90915.1 GNAT family N-acetyltransferase [Frigidibacter albus]NBE32800.1 GNAT family N-acetyltransferase [Frigidibacter albus]GGH61980.1 N-acetyltransferase [Frigidibacter albus]
MTDTLTFDRFTAEHLEGALRLSRQAGWPHRAEDWQMLLRLSRGVVALAEGQVVGTALATPFGGVAMANMIIVDAAMRGRGLGRSLMERAMALEVPEWRLTATADGLPLYEKLGFVACGRVLQHQGLVAAQNAPDGVEWAVQADLPAMVALDRQATGADRAGLIAELMAEGQMAVIRDGAALAGFAALRTFGRGAVAGPVIAASAGDAQRLLTFVFAQRPGGFLRVDTTEAAGLAPWLAAQGLAPAGGGIAMRRGGAAAPQTPFQCFALAAQALG